MEEWAAYERRRRPRRNIADSLSGLRARGEGLRAPGAKVTRTLRPAAGLYGKRFGR